MEINSPFRFGKIVTGGSFINRSDDLKRIQNNLRSSINTIIISPRRWGKSSLMRQVALKTKDPNIRFAFIDFFNIRNEEDFYKSYMKEVLKCSIALKEELWNAGKEFFSKIMPVLSFSIDPQNDLSLSLNWNEAKKSKEEIINLPERIAKKKGFRIVICIDEFQQISKLSNYIKIEQELRSYWQYHQQVSYCLYGSRKHMMLEIFKQEARAFYRFGDLFMLEKIDGSHWIRHITQSFKKANKNIPEPCILQILEITNNHPDYIQQLCHHIWNLTSTEVTEDIIRRSVDLVIRSNNLYYQAICDNLSNTQFNMLSAVLNGETHLTSVEIMKKYDLGTPNNVSKNKKKLEFMDIFDIYGSRIDFSDPMFEYWLRQNTDFSKQP